MSSLEKVNDLVVKLEGNSSEALSRIEKLFDENSFIELGGFNKNAGVITGYGTIGGRLVYAYSQNGSVNIKHAKKISNIYELALKMGAPVIGIMDSSGLKIEDGIDAFEAYGILFSNQASASGVIPQISVVFGRCLGVATFTPILSDFVFMAEEKAKLFMMSPSTFEGLEAKSITYDELGGGRTHSEKTGIAHFCYQNEETCLNGVRKLVEMLPSNNLEEAVNYEVHDDLNRIDDSLNTIIPDNSTKSYDIKAVINSVVDNNDFFEIHENYAKNIIVGFAKFNGSTTGIVANNGLLNIEACQKASEFVNICDAFNIPLVSFTDTYGYETGIEEEQKGLMRYSAKLLYAFANATVPKVNLILRNGIGNSYILMNSKHIGADVVYAWPTADIALLSKEGYVKIMKLSAEEYDSSSNPYSIANKGYIDDIIVPSTTRKRLLIALEMLATKREVKPARKHSSTEF